VCNWFASKKIAFKSLVLTTIYTEISHVIDVNSSSMNGEKSWCQSQVISHNSRGLNENHNGLLRQFFPKRMALDNVSEKEAFNQASHKLALVTNQALDNC
jgi:IS30 family transposase